MSVANIPQFFHLNFIIDIARDTAQIKWSRIFGLDVPEMHDTHAPSTRMEILKNGLCRSSFLKYGTPRASIVVLEFRKVPTLLKLASR